MKVRFCIDDYKTKFSNGIKQYLFFAMFNFPTGNNTNKMSLPESFLSPLGYNSNANIFPYLVRSTSIPESTFNEEIIPFTDFQFKMAGQRMFSDWNVSFNIDEKGLILDAFHQWHDEIYHVEGNKEKKTYSSNTADKYMKTQQLYLIDGSGIATKKIEIFNAWPKSIGQVSLDYASTEIATMEVNFSFQHYTITNMEEDTTKNNLIRSLMNRVTGTSPSNLIHGALGM